MRPTPPSDAAGRFLELLQPLEAELEAYCRRLAWDPQDVPEALHNGLARAIAGFDRYHEGTNFRAWMYTILTRESFALNRKHQRRAAREFQMDPGEIELLAAAPPADPAGASPEGLLNTCGDQLDDRLVLALKLLAEEERATLLLRALAGLKYREIAEILELPVGSVVGYLGRARQKMRHALARAGFVPSMKGTP
jgi:RNA polymerase sigma-70 factor, ECF subfamily